MQYLRQYCDIFSGYSFRTQLTDTGSSATGIIQFKDVDAAGERINYAGWANLEEFPGAAKHYLQNSDVLILTKGSNNTAFLYEEGKSKFNKAVASSSFTVIRVMPEHLDPAYVCYSLNTPESKEYFKRMQVKTTVQNLSIATLQNFQLKIPILSIQQAAGGIYLDSNERQEIVKELELKSKQLLHEKLKRLINGERRLNNIG